VLQLSDACAIRRQPRCGVVAKVVEGECGESSSLSGARPLRVKRTGSKRLAGSLGVIEGAGDGSVRLRTSWTEQAVEVAEMLATLEGLGVFPFSLSWEDESLVIRR
jgi:hypothetical protein